MFTIDLVSSLPIEILLPGSILRMLNILKIIRVFRLTTIINKMNAEEESKSVSYSTFNLIFVIIISLVFAINHIDYFLHIDV